MIFCHITTQIQGEKHGNLLSEKGGQGFPHIVFMDSEGQVLAEHAGARSAAGFSQTGEKATQFLALREKAAKGDKEAQGDLLVQQLALGHLKADDVEKKAAGLKLSDDQKKALEEALANARILEIARSLTSEAEAKKAGKTYFEMHKAGKPAPTHDDAIQAYWILMMGHAEEAKAADVFETALQALKAKFGSAPQAAAFFKKQDATLERLKAEKPEKK